MRLGPSGSKTLGRWLHQAYVISRAPEAGAPGRDTLVDSPPQFLARDILAPPGPLGPLPGRPSQLRGLRIRDQSGAVGPRTPQDGLKTAEEAPETPHEGCMMLPRMAPGWPQEAA